MTGIDTFSNQCPSLSVGPTNQLLSLLIQTILSTHCSISPPEAWPQDYGPYAAKYGLKDYDFVIVGTDSAGSVLAYRLSENPRRRVLVIEFNADPPIESEIPYFFKGIRNTTSDWTFRAQKSKKYGRGIPDGIPISAGQMLGNWQSMSDMLYLRGNRHDYKNWESQGNPGWAYEDVLECFKKSEKMLVPIIADTYSEFHGTKGRLRIDKFNYEHLGKDIIEKALLELKYPYLLDLNSDKDIGWGEATGFLTKGRRYSPVKAFLNPAAKRPNVHVIKNAPVTGLKTDRYGKVRGVNFLLNGEPMTAVARREYLLADSPYGSAKIMMVSGIGPKKQLQKAGVRVVKDLPGVGQNLQDQIFVPYFLYFRCKRTFTKVDAAIEYFNYLIYNQGTFASSSMSDIVAFFSTRESKKYPDIQITYTPYDRKSVYLRSDLKKLGYDRYIINQLDSLNEDACLVQVNVILLTPKSRGRMEIQNSEPFYPFKLYLDFLEDKDDLKTLVRGIRLKHDLFDTKAFKKYGMKEIYLRINECDKYEYDSTEYWECYIRVMGNSNQQAAGTTKMGPESDPYAVVDSDLRVYGFDNLRVVGASIFPEPVSGSVDAPAVMVGEKAAEKILETWG